MRKPHASRTRWTDERRILTLFSGPKRSYTREEVLTLTLTESEELDRLCALHDIRPEGGLYDWEDVAFLALEERWPLRRITMVLKRHRRPIPRLNRLVPLRIQLPLYQLQALKEEAARQTHDHQTPITPTDTLTQTLSTWIAAHPHLPAAITQADHWPLPAREGVEGAKGTVARGRRPARRGR